MSSNYGGIVKFISIVRRKLCISLLFAFIGFAFGQAQTAMDSIEISLLTCSPGTEVYSLYGHTALRVRDYTRDVDLVFNYGVFSFNAPHFVWRFVLGQCDYEVCALYYDSFLQEYQERGSSVVEQTLNLTPSESSRLFQRLLVNIQKENRTYRYNYLTSNCTTKVRDIILSSLDGDAYFKPASKPRSYRQIIHRFTGKSPWAQEGNDILLGATCDTLLTDYASMFVPDELEKYFADALIIDSLGQRRALVSGQRTLVPLGVVDEGTAFPLRPFAVGMLFAFFCLLVAAVEFRTRRMWWLLDAVLMTLQGVAGCLLCFMFFFSEHPTVDSNWQIWVLNPLPLLCMPWVLGRAIKHEFCLYHGLNTLFLTLFIVLSAWIPQDFAEIIVPLAFGLLMRSVSYCLNYRRR